MQIDSARHLCTSGKLVDPYIFMCNAPMPSQKQSQCFRQVFGSAYSCSPAPPSARGLHPCLSLHPWAPVNDVHTAHHPYTSTHSALFCRLFPFGIKRANPCSYGAQWVCLCHYSLSNNAASLHFHLGDAHIGLPVVPLAQSLFHPPGCLLWLVTPAGGDSLQCPGCSCDHFVKTIDLSGCHLATGTPLAISLLLCCLSITYLLYIPNGCHEPSAQTRINHAHALLAKAQSCSA